jgi:hypothetical protein
MNNYDISYHNLIKKTHENNKLTEKLLRMSYLLSKNLKLYKGPRGGFFYYTTNGTKIYLKI